jgi:hypothetical protein
LQAQSADEFDMYGARALVGHNPIRPPEQNTPGSHGEQVVDALPLYPGRQTHCEVLTAPIGDVEFSGHRIMAGATDTMLVTLVVVLSTATTAPAVTGV